jgi:hypothetical protein
MQENSQLTDAAVLRDATMRQVCRAPGEGYGAPSGSPIRSVTAISENFGILCGSVFGHDVFSRADWALALKRNHLCQESIRPVLQSNCQHAYT